MKILHLSCKDKRGGAPIAALRLHTALNHQGIDSKMLVKNKLSDDSKITTMQHRYHNIVFKIGRKIKEIVVRRLFPNRYNFSDGRLGLDILNHPWFQEADILHLHYINGDAIAIKTLKKLIKINKPMVWTMHDMWPFTGGCHFVGDCLKYKEDCHMCPVLHSTKPRDLSYRIFQKKLNIYSQLAIHYVACSQWLGNCAKESRLLKDKKISVIQNTLNINIFKPVSPIDSRDRLGISKEQFTILFGAMKATTDFRKGYPYLIKALAIFLNHPAIDPSQVQVVVFGASEDSNHDETLIEITSNIKYLGTFTDEVALAVCYDAADIFIAPSVEDNLPNTVLESLSCGTPVVAFNIGGMLDMIHHQHHGYLAHDISAEALAEGMMYYYEDKARLIDHSIKARQHILKHNIESVIAQKYKRIYDSFEIE